MTEKRQIDLDEGTRKKLFEAFRNAQVANQAYEDLAQELAYGPYGLDPVIDKITMNLITGRIVAILADKPPGTASPPPTAPTPISAARKR